MAKDYREGREKGGGMFIDDYTYVHIEPIKTADPKTYANQVVAMALVSVDFSRNLITSGGGEIAYGSAVIYTAIVGLLLYFILIRMIQKPYEVMNDELDQVLRGEIPRVTKEFKVGSLEKLWDNVNAAIQRMGKADDTTTEGVVNWEQELAPWAAIAEAGQMGLIAFDPSLVMLFVNPFFSDLSGIRSDTVGQTLAQVADQAMVSLVNDLKANAERSGTRSANDKFEFQGIDYSVVGVLIGPREQSGIALLFRKKEA
jgi:PAS domain-containing protein